MNAICPHTTTNSVVFMCHTKEGYRRRNGRHFISKFILNILIALGDVLFPEKRTGINVVLFQWTENTTRLLLRITIRYVLYISIPVCQFVSTTPCMTS